MASPIGRAAHVPRQARAHPVGTAAALYAALLGLDVWQAHSIPTAHEFLVDGIMAGVVVVSAAVAPDFVTWILLVAILYFALSHEPTVAAAITRFTKQVGA